jgi:predicted transposase YbfD/YdcC
VESVREVAGQSRTEVRFFLGSIEANARPFAKAVRRHWSIENSLHWSLDVCFGEDQSRIWAGHAAGNMVILRHMTLNILKREKTSQKGIKRKQKKASRDPAYLF